MDILSIEVSPDPSPTPDSAAQTTSARGSSLRNTNDKQGGTELSGFGVSIEGTGLSKTSAGRHHFSLLSLSPTQPADDKSETSVKLDNTILTTLLMP